MRTAIPAGADINNYKTIGCYGVERDITVETFVNSPFQIAFILDVGYATGAFNAPYIRQTATAYNSHRAKSRLWNQLDQQWYSWVEIPYSEKQELVLLNGWKLSNSEYKAFCSKCGNVGHITAWIINPSATQAWNGVPFFLPYKCSVLCDDAIYKSTGESMLVQIGGSAFFFHSDVPANTDLHINITYICE